MHSLSLKKIGALLPPLYLQNQFIFTSFSIWPCMCFSVIQKKNQSVSLNLTWTFSITFLASQKGFLMIQVLNKGGKQKTRACTSSPKILKIGAQPKIYITAKQSSAHHTPIYKQTFRELESKLIWKSLFMHFYLELWCADLALFCIIVVILLLSLCAGTRIWNCPIASACKNRFQQLSYLTDGWWLKNILNYLKSKIHRPP